MTFYVEKKLALGPIRFGVAPRKIAAAIDDDPALSTGVGGEFIHRSTDGMFFGDNARAIEATLPQSKSISQTPFLASLKPDGTARGYGFLALMLLGVLFLFIGLGVLKNKGPQGWVEIIFGVILIAIPIVMTAAKRRQIREQEERERAEREERENRNREMLTWYTNAVNHLRKDRSDAALEALRGERASLTLPYEIWAPATRRIILQIGFEELAKRGIAGATDIANVIRRSADAAGLTAEDTTGVIHDLYAAVLWHLLADDRLGRVQEAELATLRKGLEIADIDIPVDTHATEQFRDLRGLTKTSIPRADCPFPLAFQEYCIIQAPLDTGMLFITSRRLIIDERKRTEVPLPKVFEVVVDADENKIRLKTDQKKPIELRLGNPIFTAGLIELATALDERPKGFA
jgi:hypothetical protein